MCSARERLTIGLAPSITIDKTCKKCKQKVLNAYISCVECDVTYHRSCFTNISKGRANFELISENEMKCETHPPPSPNVLENEQLREIIADLKTENASLKTEISNLTTELLRARANIPLQADSTEFIKNCTTKIRADLSTVFTELQKDFNNNMERELHNLSSRITKEVSLSADSGVEKSVLPSYSQAVKQKSNILVIKPKADGQSSRETLQTIKQKIQPDHMHVGITLVKETSQGNVVIGCKSQEDLVKLTNHSKDQFHNDYHVINPKQRQPQIKIVDIPSAFEVDELKSLIEGQNPELRGQVMKWKLITLKRMKKNFMAIFEIDPTSFHTVLELGHLFIKWSSCRVFEYFNVYRCFKCGGFNHKQNVCKEEKACLKCADKNHLIASCSQPFCCINCTKANAAFNLNLDTSHSIYDANLCETLKKQIEKLRKNTIYDVTLS